jgi:AbrB family looped-hinge helix DNA binding protein
VVLWALRKLTMSATNYLTLDKKGRATLPEEVREALGVEPGDFILLDKTERGTFELVPAALVPKDDLWHLHPEFRARLREAEENFREGRSYRASGKKAIQALLDTWKRPAPTRRRRRAG